MVVTLAETTNLYPVHKLKLSVSFCSSFVSFHDTHIRLQKQSKFHTILDQYLSLWSKRHVWGLSPRSSCLVPPLQHGNLQLQSLVQARPAPKLT